MGLPPQDHSPQDHSPPGSPSNRTPMSNGSGEISNFNSHDRLGSTGSANPKTSRRSQSQASKALSNDSIFAVISLNDNFQHATLAVIVINALWIGVDTEWNHKYLVDADGNYPLEPSAVVVENLFCLYFTFEVVVRFLTFRRKCSCFRDAWFVFDSMLVTCMVLETWILALVGLLSGSSGGASFLSNFSALRLLRLLRLTRMARLMRSVPELMTLVKGMVSAAKAVFFILLFLVLLIYVFAIIFTSFIGDAANKEPEPETAEHMFGTLGDSMMSLFTHGVLGDNLSACLQALLDFPNGEGSDLGVLMLWIFLVFFATSSMTLLNMLIGVLCEVITQTADEEKDSTVIRELTMCIQDAFESIDQNADGRVTEAEWSQIKQNKHVRHQLTALGVEPAHMDERLDQMQGTLFRGRRNTMGDSQHAIDEGLSLEDLIQKVIDLRPDKPASALDVELLAAKVQLRDRTFRSRLDHVEDLIGRMLPRSAVKGGPIEATMQMSAIVPEAPAGNSTSSHLSKIPTQLLFQEIKSRSQKGNPGRGNGKLSPSQGAVSYSAIKRLCNDSEN